MEEYFAIGFKEGLQKAAEKPDGMISLDDFDPIKDLDLPFFEEQDGTISENDIESPMTDSNPQKIPKSIDPSKSK